MEEIHRSDPTCLDQEHSSAGVSYTKPRALSAHQLSKHFDYADNVLNDISLQIARGEIVSLVGPSGSGKTTLLGLLCGRLSPSTGAVERTGSIASIHQDLKLVSPLTALENVLHGATGRLSFLQTALVFPTRERRRAVELLQRVGLGEKLHSPLFKLSGGEKQRVAIARALMQGPEILLADEPIAALDEVNAHGILKLLFELAREKNLTVILVLHDRSLAEAYSDRIITLDQGKIAAERTTTRKLRVTGESEESHVPVPPSVSRPLSDSVPKLAGFTVLAMLFLWALASIQVTERQLDGALSSFLQFVSDLFPRSLSELLALPWATLTLSLLETVQMAVVGTVFGVLLSLPLAALAAHNTGPRLLREPVRLLLNIIRTIPSLIWALLFVAAVGLGPLAGILALIAYSIGYLSKFYYEAFEAVDPGPTSALGEIGASGLQRFRHSVWPAALPSALSDSIFMLEYNVRAASILGIVDAGGIGFYIKEYIDFRHFPAVTASLFLILLVVLLLDSVSRYCRTKLVRRIS